MVANPTIGCSRLRWEERELRMQVAGPAGPRERRFSAMRAFEAFVCGACMILSIK